LWLRYEKVCKFNVDSPIKNRARRRGFSNKPANIGLTFKRSSQGLAAANDTQQDDHDSDYQQNVDETANGIRADQTDQPQDYEYDCNGIEHGNFLSSYGSFLECLLTAPLSSHFYRRQTRPGSFGYNDKNGDRSNPTDLQSALRQVYICAQNPICTLAHIKTPIGIVL
jgi:hypothetical protein